ncbi:hypothetical protein EDD85DRAFT_593417 [Armillaria nabsnona]|nr:hypothetical protein EDD85DRAFT_593417 [Armillaria nabsnona]
MIHFVPFHCPSCLSTTGTADFKVRSETHQTWYKVIGDLKSGKTPLVTLHGGPGFTHEYILVYKALTESAGIPIVAYDQIGNGHLTHLRDAPSAST